MNLTWKILNLGPLGPSNQKCPVSFLSEKCQLCATCLTPRAPRNEELWGSIKQGAGWRLLSWAEKDDSSLPGKEICKAGGWLPGEQAEFLLRFFPSHPSPVFDAAAKLWEGGGERRQTISVTGFFSLRVGCTGHFKDWDGVLPIRGRSCR